MQAPDSVLVSLTAGSFGCGASLLVGNNQALLTLASLIGSMVGSEMTRRWLVEYKKRRLVTDDMRALVELDENCEDVMSEDVVTTMKSVRRMMSQLLDTH